MVIDINAIRAAHPLPVVVGASIKLERVGNEFRGCCPFHSDRSPSFTIFANGMRWYCFGCGAHGDVLDYLQRLHGIGLRQAADLLGAGELPKVNLPALPTDDRADRIEEARERWRAAQPIEDTLAERYLRARGITIALPATLRFGRLPYGRRGPEHPVLLAAVANVDGRLAGVQRTYLNPAGTGKAAVPKPKLSLGRVAGGAIRLAPPSRDLIICEGLEDGLSLAQELQRPVWVAAGASMLPAMQFPRDVRSIAIGGDADDAGRAAAQKAGDAYVARGLAARIFYPQGGAKDWNQMLLEAAR